MNIFNILHTKKRNHMWIIVDGSFHFKIKVQHKAALSHTTLPFACCSSIVYIYIYIDMGNVFGCVCRTVSLLLDGWKNVFHSIELGVDNKQHTKHSRRLIVISISFYAMR